jgi:hypothetical protein
MGTQLLFNSAVKQILSPDEQTLIEYYSSTPTSEQVELCPTDAVSLGMSKQPRSQAGAPMTPGNMWQYARERRAVAGRRVDVPPRSRRKRRTLVRRHSGAGVRLAVVCTRCGIIDPDARPAGPWPHRDDNVRPGPRAWRPTRTGNGGESKSGPGRPTRPRLFYKQSKNTSNKLRFLTARSLSTTV